MIKCIALLRKRADLSREDFIAYYETRHAPLVLSLLPGIVEYRRSFVQPGGAVPAADGSPIDFDVVTEIWLPDAEAHQRFLARAAAPPPLPSCLRTDCLPGCGPVLRRAERRADRIAVRAERRRRSAHARAGAVDREPELAERRRTGLAGEIDE